MIAYLHTSIHAYADVCIYNTHTHAYMYTHTTCTITLEACFGGISGERSNSCCCIESNVMRVFLNPEKAVTEM